MKSCEWQTKNKMRFQLLKYSSSHRTASISKWFVGSSRSKNSGSMNNARANATRIRHPPLNSLVVMCCIFWVNPRPNKIWVARASAEFASS
mmetsp:Transcript_22375/g.48678  ORF Transcript_22375/g.48678 Transcript_22375/m.48678 type:complete len:91 (-) Transcript_22375:896-1168(-)